MEKQKTVVRVAGKEYALVSSDPPEYMQRVAAYVDRKLNEMSVATRLPSNMVAVLACLNMADDSHEEPRRKHPPPQRTHAPTARDYGEERVRCSGGEASIDRGAPPPGPPPKRDEGDADEGLRGRRLLREKFRNLNRRGPWPLVSVEKDSHAQPPLAAMAVFPLLALPPEERLAFERGVLLRSWFRLRVECSSDKLGCGHGG